MNQRLRGIVCLLAVLCVLLTGCQGVAVREGAAEIVSLDALPAYAGEPYVVLEDNEPDFSQEDLTTEAFERYSPLDSLGRCGVAYANICIELMPTEERGSIGQVRPSGWQTVKYDCVDGKYLYNRCHLIGYQLAGENANEQNLITGTRYLNVEGMLPFENLVADYVAETENHVLYRVTPVFEGANLVASGVELEALSVEDGGEGVCFHVYIYNVQPGVVIDYATGQSHLAESESAGSPQTAQTDTVDVTESAKPELDSGDAGEQDAAQEYVLNTRSMKFHFPDCSGVAAMSESNRQDYTGSREELIAQGYAPCGICQP